ncbi:MAG TPA: sensor histidine kinase [Gaiellaceae bacterium]|jgi:signal transduction histidine kinase
MRARRNVAIDVALAVAAFAATLALLGHGSTRDLDGVGVVLAACATWPLLARRRSPLGVLIVTTVASATLNGFDYALGPPFGPTLALFFVAADERTRARIVRTAVVVVALLVLHLGVTGIAEGGFPLTPLLFAILVWGSAWVFGDQVRQRRQRIAQLEERALRAERESARERRLAVAEERNRIARDLHDSAGHAINVILVQAGAARLLQERDPRASREALETIEEVARETIGEIDRLVHVLRDDGSSDSVEPPAGLAALETLVDRHRAAGLAIDVDVRGPRRQLTPSVDQAAFRIVQEALTNAARHGRGGAEIVVAFAANALEIHVANAVGPDAVDRNGGGLGLVGMRERAALLGGSVDTAANDGIFRVEARLPYGGET